MSTNWETNLATWDQIGGGGDSSDFLTLVNRVLKRLNEVEIQNETQFLEVRGFHAHVKDAINEAIRDINAEQVQWPFNHVTQEQELEIGVNIYPFPADIKVADFETFRLLRDDTLSTPARHLRPISYEDYVKYFRERDSQSAPLGLNMPYHVFRTQSNGFGVTPLPDKAYTVQYEYFRHPTTLDKAVDTTTVPEQFEHVITEGAMYYAYMFRENDQAAQLADAKFKNSIKRMRSILINRTDYMGSTYIDRRAR